MREKLWRRAAGKCRSGALLIAAMTAVPLPAIAADASTLAIGDHVRLSEAHTRKERTGLVSAIDDEGLRIVPAAGERDAVTVRWESIGKLSVARGKRSLAREGALVGAFAGAAPMAALAVWACSGEGCDGGGKSVAAYVLASSAVGALTGSLIGLALKTDKWERFDTRRRDARWRVGLAPVPGGAAWALTWQFQGRKSKGRGEAR